MNLEKESERDTKNGAHTRPCVAMRRACVVRESERVRVGGDTQMAGQVHKDIKRVLFTEAEIKAAVQKVADQINKDYAKTDDLVVIGMYTLVLWGMLHMDVYVLLLV